MKLLEQNTHQVIRNIREQGLEKLSQSHFNQLALLTKDESVLQSIRSKILVATSEGMFILVNNKNAG